MDSELEETEEITYFIFLLDEVWAVKGLAQAHTACPDTSRAALWAESAALGAGRLGIWFWWCHLISFMSLDKKLGFSGLQVFLHVVLVVWLTYVIYYEIHPFQLYISVAFSFPVLCIHHHNLIPESFITPKRNLRPKPRSCLSLSIPSWQLLSVPIDLHILGISFKWNHTVCPLALAFFT